MQVCVHLVYVSAAKSPLAIPSLTYLLMANEGIQDSVEARTNSVPKPATTEKKTVKKESQAAKTGEQRAGDRVRPEIMPLNINVQIHISADASGEQIQTIFSSMRRYLYDAEPA
jgi:hypothetical protein